MVTASVAGVCLSVFVLLLLSRPDPFLPFCTDLEESESARRAAAGSAQALLCSWGAIPDELRRGRDLHTALTALFVHVSWLHLVANLAYFAVFGPLVERSLGSLRFLGLLLAAGVVAQVAHVAADPTATEPSVGLSGALSAVLAVHLFRAGRREIRVLVGVVPFRLPAWFVIGFWAGQQLVLAVVMLRRVEAVGGVAYEAHVAGFLTGALVAAAPCVRRRTQSRSASENDRNARDSPWHPGGSVAGGVTR